MNYVYKCNTYHQRLGLAQDFIYDRCPRDNLFSLTNLFRLAAPWSRRPYIVRVTLWQLGLLILTHCY